MAEAGIAIAIMAGLALVFGVILTLAHKRLRVVEDPRIDEVSELLPGANCGACGQPGCRAFAEAVVEGRVAPGKCTVSPAEGIAAIAAYLGVDAGAEEKRVARLHCGGGKSSVRDVALYRGMASCRAAAVVNGGSRACPWGCLGLGDCERSCTFGAITMNAEGLPVVDVAKCTACNDCVVTCPLGLLALHPISDTVLVQCKSLLTGAAARAVCAVACDGCGRCAQDAPAGAIAIERGLAVVKQPSVAGPKATFRCPTGAIEHVVGNQFRGAMVPMAQLKLAARR